jgi:hypothetical protein
MGPKSNERSAGQTHSGGTVFGRNKQPTVGDYVDVVREQASTAVDKGLDKGADLAQTYGPKAREQALAAADAAAAAARTYGPIARERAAEAYEAARPRVEEVYRERLDPYVQEALKRAEPYVDRAVETAAPRVQRAVENLEPKVDKAHDVIVDAWIPRISAAIAALAGATVAAKEQVVEVSERAPDAVAVLKGDKVAKQPKGGKVLIGLGIVAAVGAVVVVLANRKPKDDPWATPSTSYTPPAKTFGDRVADAKDTVTTAAGTAAHKAGELADKAKDAAGDAGEKAKDAVGDAADKAKTAASKATGAAKDAAAGAADEVKDTGSDTVDVLGDVADTAAETSGDVAADVAGAAADVKADVSKGAAKAKDQVDGAT